MCELLVGLPAVRVLGIDEAGGPLSVHVETIADRPTCPGCGGPATLKDRDVVELIDLPAFGRRTRLVWHKHRWCCRQPACPVGSWTAQDPAIAASRLTMTDRAGRWVTEQIGRFSRSVNELADELGCDWHTVNDTMIAYGTALVDDDPDRLGETDAVGIDEVLFVRLGPWHTKQWATSIVDVRAGRLLDVVPGRDHKEPCAWFDARNPEWLARIEWATLDLCGPYRFVFSTMLPDATQVADPFHVVKLANTRVDDVRRRVQNETLGHRGRKDDPLYRCRRLLTKADERLDDKGRTKLLGLLDAGDPCGEVRPAWHAKEVVRTIWDHTDAELADVFVDRLGHDLQDRSSPPEVRQLGRTLLRWKDQIVAWHRAHVTNAATEAANNLIKRVKRGAFGRPGSATSGSVSCSTPDDPTGTCYPPSHPAEIREPLSQQIWDSRASSVPCVASGRVTAPERAIWHAAGSLSRSNVGEHDHSDRTDRPTAKSARRVGCIVLCWSSEGV